MNKLIIIIKRIKGCKRMEMTANNVTCRLKERHARLELYFHYLAFGVKIYKKD